MKLGDIPIPMVWAAVVGIGAGIAATLLFRSVIGSADIDYECSSNVNQYSCEFFNKGPGAGAMCVVVKLRRDTVSGKSSSDYIKGDLAYSEISGKRICSGPLTKGQDKSVEGGGFTDPEGKPVSGEDLCRLKQGGAYIAGCVVVPRSVARTH
jgi:hypothetical protein